MPYPHPAAAPLDPGVAVRAAAIAALLEVERGHTGSQLALQPAIAKLQGADRGLCTELVYGTLRRQRPIDRWIAASCDRGLAGIEAGTLAALRVGAYQLAELPRIPAFAAVDATTEAFKRTGKPHRGAVGFVHAVLRKLAGRAERGDHPDGDDLPEWMARRCDDLAADLALDPVALRRAMCEQAPSHGQALARAEGVPAIAERLRADGVWLADLPVPGAFVADGARATQHPQLGRAFLLQDAASAAIARWIDPQPGSTVVDLCAGRGVKTALLAALGAEVTAVDVAADKIAAAKRLVQATGGKLAQAIAADASVALALPAGAFDAVLVDAPCTGLGTLRRRPEIRHRRRAADLWSLTALADALADTAVQLARPGGLVVLASCSLCREEGPLWVDRVLARHPGVRRAGGGPAWAQPLCDSRGDLRTHPLQAGMDAFFAARLVKDAPP